MTATDDNICEPRSVRPGRTRRAEFDLAGFVERSAAKSALPTRVTDEAVLRAVAELLAPTTSGLSVLSKPEEVRPTVIARAS